MRLKPFVLEKSLLFCLLLFSVSVFSQPTKPAYQVGYFLFPIMPGSGNSLSGGLGDLRPNHFHAGIDIRTQGREGLDVHAAADGYVSRIAVFTGGYGNVVFIKHPNGLTTVYGHLKTLTDTLGRYLRAEQYRSQTFEIDLRPAPGQFRVEQGAVIAASGNTGGSGGPHLHFEIRDAKDNLLNPMLFGFPELTDDVPPYFERIALKTMTADSRLNGEYQRVSYAPVRQPDGSYVLNHPVRAAGLLGLEVLAYDKTSGSPYRNGISCLELRLDGRELFAYTMNGFPNEQTRQMNVHENYEAEQLFGQRYHRAYIADGNTLPNYRSSSAYRGRISLLDGQPHEVTVTLYDSFDHAAQLTFTVLPELTPNAQRITDSLAGTEAENEPDELQPQTYASIGQASATVTTDENVLKVAVRGVSMSNPPPAKLIVGRDVVATQTASYVVRGQAVYLIDLRQVMPDLVQVGNGAVQTNFKKRIIPGQPADYTDGNLRLQFAARTLFDTLHLATRTFPNGGLEINQRSTPIFENLTISYIPTLSGAVDTMRTKAYQADNQKFLGGSWQVGRITFQTRELGRFALYTDTEAPAVRLVSATTTGITARVSDDLSGIKSFRAMVGGQWVLLQYDYKTARLWSDKLDPDAPFVVGDEVVIEATDRCGNVGSVSGSIAPVRARAVVRKKASPKKKGKKRR